VNSAVAMIGLGEAGSAIAADLVSAGATVRGWDPVAPVPDERRANGGRLRGDGGSRAGPAGARFRFLLDLLVLAGAALELVLALAAHQGVLALLAEQEVLAPPTVQLVLA
jgi:NAD binding domain of 6-phosphogluconate dehydrogenase